MKSDLKEKLRTAATMASSEPNLQKEIKVESDSFYKYKGTPFTATKNNKKFRPNMSFDQDTMEMLMYMLFQGGYSFKQKSDLGELSTILLYTLYHELLEQKNINILTERLTAKEILDAYKAI